MQAGINPKLISAHHSRVSDLQMTRLVQLIWQAMGDEFMGFTQSPCKQGAFAIMSQAARQCKTLREALQSGTRFYNYITEDIHTEISETASLAQLSIRFARPELDPDNFYLEFWLVIWHRFSSWLTGKKIPLLETTLTCSKPQHASELQYLFPGTIQFNSPNNQLLFSAEQLNLPIIRSKKELTAFLIHSPADLMTIPGEDNSLRNIISQLVKEHNRADQQAGLDFPSIEQIASQLHLTPITLHRRLKLEGTNYQQIKETIRRDIALTKLIKERLKVKDVAAIVGFSESSSFTRAFKSWTGLSPREFCKFINPTSKHD
jgi:AraC-like DNA-binding protein